YPGSLILWTTSKPKGRRWETALSGQTLLKKSIMSKLETARKLAKQTAGQEQNAEKAVRVDWESLDQLAAVLKSIMDSQKALNKQQHSLGHGLSKKLAPIDSLEKWMKDMENTQMDLVKQQQKTRKLLMAIFFTGIVPLLAFITALVLKVLVLT